MLELVTEPGDLSLQVSGLEAVAGSCDGAALMRAQHAGADEPLERGGVL